MISLYKQNAFVASPSSLRCGLILETICRKLHFSLAKGRWFVNDEDPRTTTMTTSTRKNFLLCLAFVGLSAASVSAQSNTVPAGYFTVNIAAGLGTSAVNSVVSFPLQGTAAASGQMVGLITGVTSNTITNGNAGWTAGQLSVQATPYLIQITSGTATGRTFLIATVPTNPVGATNTSTTLTLDAAESNTDLTTLGIVIGTDTYQIIPADTISSIFGTPATTGIQGGATAAQADQIQLLPVSGSSWSTYYYNTTSAQWLHVGAPIPSNNVVIRPDTGVVYVRLAAAPLTLTLLGQAPAIQRQAVVSNTGITLLSTNFPVGTTLGASNIQNIPGWVSGANSSVADTVQIFNGSWSAYFYNGTDWIHVGAPFVSDSVAINAGSAAVLVKRGTAAGQNILTQPLPYSLN